MDYEEQQANHHKENEVEDYEDLKNFLDWAEEISDGLAEEYGIDI